MPETDVFILKALLESENDFVSGNQLASALGISRVGVWARLEKFRDDEFIVEAVRHRGYRLLKEPPTVNESLVRAYLAILGCDADVVFCDTVDSTNTEAERQLAAARQTPFTVMALKQTQGRGRLGRKWHSPNEGNLYASFAFRPNLPPLHMQTITLWMGLKVCEFVNEQLGIPARIKWPNDLIAGGKKVAGMLTEARVDADRTRDLIFGIGLNVNGHCQEWPEEVSSVATSLAQIKGEHLQINQIAARLTQACVHAYEDFIAGKYQGVLVSLWNRYDALLGKEITCTCNGGLVSGTAQGIDDVGRLLLKSADGTLIKLNSGEVSLGSSQFATAG